MKEIQKTYIEEYIKDFRVTNVTPFINYLKEIWKDLVSRNEDKQKGVNKVIFNNYYYIPGILSERLFSVFDTDANDILDAFEFIEGMTILFTESFEKQIHLIFNLYDFDKDGFITKEDAKIIFANLPTHADVEYTGKETFYDRKKLEKELTKLLEFFGDAEKIDLPGFINIIENKSSEMFVYVLVFLMQSRPFTKESLEIYEEDLDLINLNKIKEHVSDALIAKPHRSEFAPNGVGTSTSPVYYRRTSQIESEPSLNESIEDENITNIRSSTRRMSISCVDDDEEEGGVNKISVIRKHRNTLSNLGNFELVLVEYPEAEEILPAHIHSDDTKDEEIIKLRENVHSELGLDPIFPMHKDHEKIKFEGYLYKMNEDKKIKKIYFKLRYQDLYYYADKEDHHHKGMHHLSGVFLKEEKPIEYQNHKLYAFSITYPKKQRIYYVDNFNEYEEWLIYIKLATGYSNLFEKYELKEKLGTGRFGIVRIGIHKMSGNKIAIKAIDKTKMHNKELQLVMTEIDILKICHHPNIVKLYDVYENLDHIYIVQEHCEGGDLFGYLEKRNFKLSEKRAQNIIYKICNAVYYLHSIGIVHRDLKPENILMIDKSDESDIKLVDFGLSLILGNGQFCKEGVGTLSYVAPEVLTEKPYDRAIDLWSIGIITFLLLTGELPYDDASDDREVVRQTVHEPVIYSHQSWKNITSEARIFVEKLLNKDQLMRMNIKEALKHPWLATIDKVTRRKSQNN